MFSWRMLWPRHRQKRQPTSTRVKLAVESLEVREVLAAPVVNSISNIALPSTNTPAFTLPVGKTLFLPVANSDADGDALTVSASSSVPGITVTSRGSERQYVELTMQRVPAAGGAPVQLGTMTFQLFDDLTPITVNAIRGLVNQEFYDGLTFHRVISNFVIQGGDPKGDGTGGPPNANATALERQQLQFVDEYHRDAIFTGNGQLAMAKSGNDSNGSQFFVTIGTQRHLDFNHTIFGQLVRGFDVLETIRTTPVAGAGGSTPVDKIEITRAEVVKNSTDSVLLIRANDTAASGTITITVDDGKGNQTQQTVQIQSVTDPLAAAPTFANDPPFLVDSSIQHLATNVNVPITVNLEALDIDTGTQTLNLVVITDGSTQPNAVVNRIDADSFQIVPTQGFIGQVLLGVSVQQQENINRVDTQTFVLTVGDGNYAQGSIVPVVSTLTEGVTGNNVPVANFRFDIPNAQPSDFVATINWGDTHVSTGVLEVDNGLGSARVFTVKGTNTYREAGRYPVTISLVHKIDANRNGTVTTIRSSAVVQDAPISGQGTAVSGSVNTTLTSVEVARFTPAANHPLTDFRATIQWGDGTSSAGTLVAQGNGDIVVQGTHQYASTGNFAVSTRVVDVDTSADVAASTATLSTTAAITNPALNRFTQGSVTGIPITSTENQSTPLVNLATFKFDDATADPNQFKATVKWGDGGINTDSRTIVVVSGTGVDRVFAVQGAYNYAKAGSYTAEITITRDATANTPTVSTTLTTQATVADGVLTAQSVPFQASVNQALTDIVVATFSDAAGNSVADDFQATITWGDGSNSPGTIRTRTGGGFEIVGSHTYTNSGSFTVGVQISQKTPPVGVTASTASTTANLVVSGLLTFITGSVVGLAVSAGENKASGTVNLASFRFDDANALASQFRATVNWGDGNTETDLRTIQVGSGSGTARVFTVQGSHTYTKAGKYTIAVTITRDATANSPTVSTTVNTEATIADAQLTAQGVSFQTDVNLGLPNIVVATLADDAGNSVAHDFQASIAWGDGASSLGVVVNRANGGFQVLGSHMYAQSGTFTVSVQISQKTPPTGVSASTATATATAQVGSPSTPQDPTNRTPNERWLASLYRTLLGREGVTSELTQQAQLLQQGRTRQQLVTGLLNSGEYRVRLVEQLYQRFLGRSADTTGLRAHIDFLARGGTEAQLMSILVGSTEYFQRSGGTLAGFLAAAYRDLLGRPLDTTGSAGFGRLGNSSQARATIASVLVQSVEQARRLVQTQYSEYLGRAADVASLNAFAQLYTRVGERPVLVGLLASDEFFTRAQQG